MPLNNSGPLSFGGTTVGQSINLELGLSATATASINSTAFRTLAGVPSGQISVSNFYGKSNAIGWVLWIGNPPNSGAFILNAGFFVDAQSNVYWGFLPAASSYGIAKASSSGTLSTFINAFDGSGGEIIISSTRASTPSVAARAFNTDSPVLYGSTLNRVYPGTVRSQNDFSRYGGAITANNELVLSGMENFDGYNGRPTIVLINSAGTSAVNYKFSTLISDHSNQPVLRTDGQIVQMWRRNSTLSFYPYSSALSPLGTQYDFNVSSGSDLRFRACVDSSNNIFVVYSGANFVERYNSSYTNTHRVSLDSTPFGFGMSGVATHGGNIYILSNAFNFTWVTCLSASNLSIQWTNRFNMGSDNYAPITANAINTIHATADGVFFGLQFGNGFPAIIIKIPLTGMPSDSSVAITGTVRTLSWVRETYTVTTRATLGVSSFSVMPALITPATRTPVSGGSSVTPTATKTDIV